MGLNRKRVEPGTVVKAGKGLRVVTGKPQPTGEDRMKAEGMACIVAGCGRDRKARGFCNTHYLRAMKTGDPGGPVLMRSTEKRVALQLRIRVTPGTVGAIRAMAEQQGYDPGQYVGIILDRWAKQMRLDDRIGEYDIPVEIPSRSEEIKARYEMVRIMSERGYSAYAIGQELGIHPDSVSRIRAKLGISGRTLPLEK